MIDWLVGRDAEPRRWLRPRIVLGSCAVIVAAVSFRPVHHAFTGRASPPALLALEARRALDRAGDAGAREWAPGLLDEAESALRAGRTEEDLQASRWLPFRDFGKARSGYQRAIGAARRAEAVAAQARSRMIGRVEERLARVGEVVGQVVKLTRGMRLEQVERRSLRVALLRLAEARIQAESGRYRSADRLAGEALAHARKGAEHLDARAARYVDEDRVREWRAWEKATIVWSRRHQAAAIVVNKEENRLTLYIDGKPERTLRADVGQSHFDAKLLAEDGATPEGRYRITRKKGKGRSQYHKALELNYPNEEDRRRHAEAVRSGRVPRGVGAGNLIEIHGDGGRGTDWTRGCVALSNRDIDYVFESVRVGTPVTIIGGDGSGGRFSSLVSRLIAARGDIDAYAGY